jgi:hypothetical protein
MPHYYNSRVLRQTINVFITLAILALSVACAAPTTKLRPVVDVISPADGAYFAPGERIALRVAAASGSKIARVELRVGGALVATQTNPTPSETFSTQLDFTPPAAGQIALTVTAVDANGQSSDPANLTVVVGTPRAILDPAGSGAAAATPDSASTPSSDPNGAQAGECKLSATFVTDVTIPDNTVVNAGSTLIKTWRLRNTSECAWDNGYQLAYIEGEQMGATSSVPVAPTAKDAAVDISVPFTAPAQSGTYTSTWRMRSPDGNAFGNRVFMVIRVP